MKRRDFVKSIPLFAGLPFALGGVPMRLMAESHLARLAQMGGNDKVLIILQLHGGNDGLNMLIPVHDYDLYYSRRANIAIPKSNSVRKYIMLDSTLASEKQIGLHPDMIAMKDMYDRGRVTFVQGVSYKNNNGSHFRGRDIWFMGGGSDDYFSSGWVGRYLQKEFAPSVYPDDFPNNEMPDPLAIEMGNDVSLIFHQEGNIPTSLSLGGNPRAFAELVEGLEGFMDEGIDPRGKPPAALENSPYGKELNWILGLEDKTAEYADRLREVYLRSPATRVTYPERYAFNAPPGIMRNPLTPQLQLIARLLDGGGPGLGVKTKVFMVRIGGFDTHAQQVESYDPTMGFHSALLYHISTAMKAFQEDLRERGLEDRVLTVTTSEFGRRIPSNGSFGTDHGTGGPLMLFGKGVHPGVVGTTPDLQRDNIGMQYDYRQVYAGILKEWMEVDKTVLENDIFFGNFIDGQNEDGINFTPLPLVSNVITGTGDFFAERFRLEKCYPNPAREYSDVSFFINADVNVSLDLLDANGKPVRNILHENMMAGEHKSRIQLHGIPAGLYIIRLNAGIFKSTQKLIVVK